VRRDAVIDLATLPTEGRLLFAAARPDENSVDIEAVRAAARAVTNWDTVLELGQLSRVQPLLQRSLQSHAKDLVPRATLGAMKGHATVNWMRNEAAVRELAKLEAAFAVEGIRTIHYKGATVATRMYPSIALRTFHDMDFLIDYSDLPDVCRIVETMGYRLETNVEESERDAFESEKKEYLFRRDSFSIEPHWRFLPFRYDFPIDVRAIHARSDSVELGGTSLRVPSIEDSMVLMMLVGAAGFWKRLQMLSDIAACAALEPQWPTIEREMRRLHAMWVMLLAILMAHELCGAAIPPALLERARAVSIVRRMARRVAANLADAGWTRAAPKTPPRRLQWLLWHMRDGWRDRMVYLARTATTPTTLHTRRMPLPGFAHSLYRVLVPLHDYLLQPGVHAARRLADRN
jgi:hypothetical protein